MGKQSKKILFITNIPAPYRIDFYNELGKHYDVTVIFEAKRAPGITFNWKEDEIHNFNAIFLKEGNINEKKVDWSIFKYLNNTNADEIIVTNYAYATEMMALLYIKLKKKPYYYEIDGAMVNYNESSLKRLIKKFFISGAKGYFSPSKVSDNYIKFYAGDQSNIFRYHFTSINQKEQVNILPTLNEKIILRNKLNISEEKIIIAIGQFIPRKGFDILLKAAKYIDKSAGIYIIGGKPTKEYIKLKEDMNLQNVHFEGFKTKEQLSEYFKAADIFVHPTREDIWGLVINEAISYGLPVITTNKCVAGVELLNPEAIIEADNITQLSDKINMFLNNHELLLQQSEENFKRSKEFTIENMVLDHLNVL